MSKEVLSTIFDPYFSTKQTTNQRGMGLGLTICHTIIRNHGGAIALESEMGVGTTVQLHLPASQKLRRKENASAAASPLRRGKILVMDDEEQIRILVGMSLRRMGHEVKLAENGQQAIDAYGRAKHLGHPFDVVILDLTVRAGVGGKEAIQALLQIDPTVKAIVMSGYSGDPVLTDPKQYGFKGVLAKPFDLAKLQEIISQVIGSDNNV
jgi:CheY-like chemotaxis protein